MQIQNDIQQQPPIIDLEEQDNLHRHHQNQLLSIFAFHNEAYSVQMKEEVQRAVLKSSRIYENSRVIEFLLQAKLPTADLERITLQFCAAIAERNFPSSEIPRLLQAVKNYSFLLKEDVKVGGIEFILQICKDNASTRCVYYLAYNLRHLSYTPLFKSSETKKNIQRLKDAFNASSAQELYTYNDPCSELYLTDLLQSEKAQQNFEKIIKIKNFQLFHLIKLRHPSLEADFEAIISLLQNELLSNKLHALCIQPHVSLAQQMYLLKEAIKNPSDTDRLITPIQSQAYTCSLLDSELPINADGGFRLPTTIFHSYSGRFDDFAYAVTKGNSRHTQEDALAWFPMPWLPGDLDPIKLGHRLWTCYLILNQLATTSLIEQGGTTASSTVYDGKKHFITATAGDAASFVLVFDKKDNIIGVMRLNTEVHNTALPGEKERIYAAKGKCTKVGRPEGMEGVVHKSGCEQNNLAITRSLGDRSFPGVCADAKINIHSIDKIRERFPAYHCIKVMTCTDGFTDGLGLFSFNAPQEKQEFAILRMISAINDKIPTNSALAQMLCEFAIIQGSRDNISVLIQTVHAGQPFFIGAYDGHGGDAVSKLVASEIQSCFKKLCFCPEEAYTSLPLSSVSKQVRYRRDNKDETFEIQSMACAAAGSEDLKAESPLLSQSIFKSESTPASMSGLKEIEITPPWRATGPSILE